MSVETQSLTTVYAQPGTEGSKVTFKPRYEHWIGGQWVPPVQGRYFENISPVNGRPFTEVARGTAEDIDAALDAAWAAAPVWGKTPVAERALVLHRIADRMEQNLEMLAVAETWDNGKPVRETINADIALAIDHFRYFAGAIRAQEGTLSQLDDNTTSYHFHEPLGVVGQIIPWNFPILMGVWKLAPALAAGNAVVLKPAEWTPLTSLRLAELALEAGLPEGLLQVVTGKGSVVGERLVDHPTRIPARRAEYVWDGEVVLPGERRRQRQLAVNHHQPCAGRRPVEDRPPRQLGARLPSSVECHEYARAPARPASHGCA